MRPPPFAAKVLPRSVPRCTCNICGSQQAYCNRIPVRGCCALTVPTCLRQSGVRVMIDAEHSYFQPAIDHAAMEVQRRFNGREPVVYNTYQCYLKDSSSRYILFASSAVVPGLHLHALARSVLQTLSGFESDFRMQRGPG